MAARSTITLNDRAGTPVAHAFTPDGDDANGVHIFTEKTGIPAANRRLTVGLRFSGDKYRPTIRFQLPVVQTQTLNGIDSPVTVRTAIAEVNFTFDKTSLPQERKDAVGFMANVLLAAQTQIDKLLVDLEDIY